MHSRAARCIAGKALTHSHTGGKGFDHRDQSHNRGCAAALLVSTISYTMYVSCGRPVQPQAITAAPAVAVWPAAEGLPTI